MNLFDLIASGLTKEEYEAKNSSTPTKEVTWEDERRWEAEDLKTYRGWFTYFMVNRRLGIVKIGKSHNVLKRHEILEKIFNMDLEIIYVEKGDHEKKGGPAEYDWNEKRYIEPDKGYHHTFRKNRIGREFFTLSKDILDWIDYMEGTIREDFESSNGETVKARIGDYGKQYWSMYLENGNSGEDVLD